MRVLPKPHAVELREGYYWVTGRDRITIDASCHDTAACRDTIYSYAKLLAEEFEEQTGFAPMIDRRVTGGHAGVHLQISEALKERLGEEAYHIAADDEGVVLTGADEGGLLYAVQTLRQIIRQEGLLIPFMELEDYPELPVRGYFYDVTRGRIPTMDYLKRVADTCSFYKINQMHLYIEHTFLFDGLSEVWRDDTPLTAEDILELDEYCSRLHIDLVPSIATFGHLYKLLCTKTFRGLSELEEKDGQAFSFSHRMHHHTLNVTDDEALALVYRMIDEYAPLFRSKLFNINCDETFDLGKGKGKARADEVGTLAMYIDWVNKICAHVKELGKRPMFWGDIIAAKPETIKDLPEDIICMTWDYGLAPGDTNVRRLWENGAKQYLCPGVQGWNQLINRFDTAYANIRKMANLAHKFEGEGLLVTDWGDYGHIQHPDFAVIGLIYAAAMGWNSDIEEKETLNEDISLLEFNDRSGRLVSILDMLSNQAVMTWGHLIEFEEELRYRIFDRDIDEFWKGYLPQIERKLPYIQEYNTRIDQCQYELCRMMPQLDSADKKRAAAYLVMSDGQKILNRLLAVLVHTFLDRDDVLSVDAAGLAEELEIWYYDYKKLWRSVSRESELYRIGEAIFWTADYLRGLSKQTV